jgi:hypothetical protein
MQETNTTFLKTTTWKRVQRDNTKTDFKEGFIINCDETSGYITKEYNPH